MASEEHGFALPQNLSTLALERFDELNSIGKLIYGPSTPEVVQHDGFTFQFSIPPAVSTKPVLPPSDPSRSKPGGPFLHPDPQFVLCRVGGSHTLELNKHCILRPMYILHTTEYEKQKDDLDLDDLRATWTVLKYLALEGEEVMAIYNCGAEAGASQGHKHVQIFPRPTKEVFELWADTVETAEGRVTTKKEIPYKHALMRISKDSTAEDVRNCYETLLAEIRPILEANGTEDYNMILVREWMLMIPRRHHGKKSVEANAVGMMGMVWLKSQEEREGWTEFGTGGCVRGINESIVSRYIADARYKSESLRKADSRMSMVSEGDSPPGGDWLGGDWKSVAICHGRFTLAAIIRRREHGGESDSTDEDREEAAEAVRDLEDEAVEEVMSSFVAICKS